MTNNPTNNTQRGYIAPQAPKPGMGYTPPQPPTQQRPAQTPSTAPPAKK